MTTVPDRKPMADDPEWAKRKSANIRLGLVFGAIALAIFIGVIFKYRPL